MAKDYYQILGVSRTASEADIRKAFRKPAHEHHPDKSSGNEQKFKEINEAYQVLSNAEKRKRYDQFGSDFDGASPRGGGSYSWNQSAGGPFGGFGSFDGFTDASQFDFGDLGDILGGMFGFGDERQGAGRQRARKGASVETVVTITFAESFFGTEKTIRLQMMVPCAHCAHTGAEPGSSRVQCHACKGTGRLRTVRNTMLGAFQTESICSTCKGVGSRPERLCTICKGEGRVRSEEVIRITIPAGIDESQSIRLSGKGEAGEHGGSRGDLYVKIHIEADKHFKRDGYDVISTEHIPFTTLVLGGDAVVKTMQGDISLTIPAGTPSGTAFTLKDKGFERLNGKGKGKHVLTVQAAIPKKITAEQRKLLEALDHSLSTASSRKSWWA